MKYVERQYRWAGNDFKNKLPMLENSEAKSYLEQ